MTDSQQTTGAQQAPPAEAPPSQVGPPEDTSAFDEVSSEGIFSGGPLAILARLGSLRVFIVLALIWIIFQSQNDNFLTAFNLTNLVLQIAAVGMISIGVTLILLLGEIDLSVGAVSGLCAAVMAVLNVKHGWGPGPAILARLGVGLAIGLLNGFFVTQFGIPSFVVTLSRPLAWQGALLRVLGDTGTLNVNDSTITGLTSTFYKSPTSWIMGALVIAAYGVSGWLERLRRARAGLAPPPLLNFAVRFIAVAIGTIV